MWQRRRDTLHIVFNGRRRLYCIFFTDTIDGNHHGSLAVKGGPQEAFLKVIFDRGDIANGQIRAIGASQHDDVFEFVSSISLTLAAEQNFTTVGLDRAAGHIQGRTLDGAGNCAQGQSVLA